MPVWEPADYLRYADERTRPFVELLSRTPAGATSVVDLGCGPGHLMRLLRERWPLARLVGVDSSPDMLETARSAYGGDGISYEQADVRTWELAGPLDVVITNATLQWVPDHLPLLRRWRGWLAPGGALAMSVPGNHGEPSHVLLRELAARAPYARWTGDREQPTASDARTYFETLSSPGWQVDVWETTYLHVLTGPDPVLSWLQGTGARPVLQALPPDLRERFTAEYAQALRVAYPPRPYGTVLPFRRVFAVATREPA